MQNYRDSLIIGFLVIFILSILLQFLRGKAFRILPYQMAILFLFLGSFLLFLVVKNSIGEISIRTDGIRTTGIVKDFQKGKTGPYAHQDSKISYTFKWKNDTFSSISSQDTHFFILNYSENDPIEVLFLESDPQKSIIANDYRNLIYSCLGLVASTCLFLLSVVFVQMKYRRNPNLILKNF